MKDCKELTKINCKKRIDCNVYNRNGKKYCRKTSSDVVKNRIKLKSGNILYAHKKTPLEISEKEYKNLIDKSFHSKLTKKENTILEKALFNKYCHCVKKGLIINFNKNKNNNNNNNKNNPYGYCTSSIYNNRCQNNICFKRYSTDKKPNNLKNTIYFKADPRKCKETFDYYN